MKAYLKDTWQPKWLTSKPDGWARPRPSYLPEETNHQRVLRQRKLRRQRMEAVREAEKAEKQIDAA